MTEEKPAEAIFRRMEMGLEIWIAWIHMWQAYLNNLALLADAGRGFLDNTKRIHESYGVFKQYG